MANGRGKPKAYGITEFEQKETPYSKQLTTDNAPAFQGSYLFVHHDAQHMKAGPHRSSVFSHVQGRYRRWKRRETTKALKESIQVPGHAEQERPFSPKTLLAQGNSDPFKALPVKIGPEENNLIAFYRDVVIPAQYDLPFRIPNLETLRASDWEDCRGGLQDGGIAHASLARYGQIMSKRTSSLNRVTIEHHHESTQILLKKVQNGQLLQDFNSYFHITMLFSAETLSRNLSGALAHGQMLRHMFEDAYKLGILDYKLLLYQLYNDCQLSSMFLVRPIWDVEKWLPMTFAPVWDAATPYLPYLDHVNDNIDPSIHGKLAEHFRSLRENWAVLMKQEESPTPGIANPAIMGWLLSKGYLLHGRVVNHYLDLQEPLRSQTLPQIARNEIVTQQFLALATIYYLKVLSRDPIVLGVPVFDARSSLLPALRASLEESLLLSSGMDNPWNSNARLWALYVGAMSEHAWPTPGFDPHLEWFNTRLAEQAISMQLRTWEEMQRILEGFLYFHQLRPNGSGWFEQTLKLQRRSVQLMDSAVQKGSQSFRNSDSRAKVAIPALHSRGATK